MSKLFSANLIRLRKDKFFWMGMFFMFITGAFFPVMRFMDSKQTGFNNNIDNGFFACAVFIGIVMAIFCSLFIGTEYSDGTIRNKVVVGQKRTAIYWAGFLTSATVSVGLCAVFFFPYLCIGIPLLGFFEMDIPLVILFTFTVFMLAVAFSSIFTLISMLNHNKAVTAVICILLAFFLLFAGAQLNKMINEPETNRGLVIKDSGQEYQEIPNPKHLEGGKRKIVHFLYDFMPGGQALQCASLEAANVAVLPAYSLIIIAVTTGAGLFFFQKKELK